jgi:hypothetical protein
LKPTTPQNAAGILAEPAESEPMPNAVQRVATAAASPPDEPPLMNPFLYGLMEVPQTKLLLLILNKP